MEKSDNLRAQWHDYRTEGYYMITMVTDGRQRAFGTLVGDSEETAQMVLSELGRALEHEIESQCRRHDEVEIEEYVIMEDHCHIFVHVKREMSDHLGRMVWGIKYGTTVAYLNALNDRDGGVHRVAGSRPSKSQRKETAISGGNTARNMAGGGGGFVEGGASAFGGGDVGGRGGGVVYVAPLWGEGYHDRVVTRIGQIARQKRYIRRNVARLWLKRHSNGAAVRVRGYRLIVPLAMAQRLKDAAIYWDKRRDVYHSPFSHSYDNAHYAESYVELVQHFLRRSVKTGEVYIGMKVCGDVALLESGRPLVRVRISRSVTKEDFDSEVERILMLCEREGAIVVSPFRSWSEKAVLNIVRMNGYGHIILHGESMWDGWKPQDGSTANHSQRVPDWFRRDYAELLTAVSGDMQEVYDGRCLIVALWPDRPRGMRAGKADCEVMNEVARTMQDASTAEDGHSGGNTA